MPIKYIGQTTNNVGKTLWEIIGNLQNYGVGRIIARGSMERYPEPCYIKICKVEALPHEERRKVDVWAEKVFRGRKYPELVRLSGVTFKADYKLIPKDEEASYCKCNINKRIKVLPRTAPLPPLLRALVIRDRRSQGQPESEPRMVLQYKQSIDNVARLESEDTLPTIEIKMDLGKPASPQFA
ncbi:hypothetical protein R5R35_000638 [Gryllus longicercus]|uniref:Uncharacterized protein n=1 Tax=Gryllus longicercus TaxID=2509291 RepID=A0AAN9VRD0_9ORTH